VKILRVGVRTTAGDTKFLRTIKRLWRRGRIPPGSGIHGYRDQGEIYGVGLLAEHWRGWREIKIALANLERLTGNRFKRLPPKDEAAMQRLRELTRNRSRRGNGEITLATDTGKYAFSSVVLHGALSIAGLRC